MVYLSREIGFDDDIVNGWNTLAQIRVERRVAWEYTNTRAQLKAVVAEEQEEEFPTYQVLMSGHPLIVLE